VYNGFVQYKIIAIRHFKVDIAFNIASAVISPWIYMPLNNLFFVCEKEYRQLAVSKISTQIFFMGSL